MNTERTSSKWSGHRESPKPLTEFRLMELQLLNIALLEHLEQKFDLCKDCRVFLKVYLYFLKRHEAQACSSSVGSGLHLGSGIGCVCMCVFPIYDIFAISVFLGTLDLHR